MGLKYRRDALLLARNAMVRVSRYSLSAALI